MSVCSYFFNFANLINQTPFLLWERRSCIIFNKMKTKRVSVKDLLESGECKKEVEISGWVRTKRGNKQVNFIALNDGSTINNIQVVVETENFPEELLKKITTGAAIHVQGILVESCGSGQCHEIQAKQLEVLGEADPDKYPIQPKKHSLEFLREVAHLRFRTNVFGAVFRKIGRAHV